MSAPQAKAVPRDSAAGSTRRVKTGDECHEQTARRAGRLEESDNCGPAPPTLDKLVPDTESGFAVATVRRRMPATFLSPAGHTPTFSSDAAKCTGRCGPHPRALRLPGPGLLHRSAGLTLLRDVGQCEL